MSKTIGKTTHQNEITSHEPLSSTTVWIIFIAAMLITTTIILINIPCILGIVERTA